MTRMRIIKIFLASSSELKDDREQFEIFINRKNKEYIKKSIFLELVLWEDFFDHMSPTRLQDEYNKAITDCDVFVSLFYTKVGQYTEEEFLKALETFKSNNKLLIYTYFNDSPISPSKASQFRSLLDFKDKLSELGHFYKLYKNIGDLKYLFDQQLNKFIPELTDNIKADSQPEKQESEQFLKSQIRQLKAQIQESERSHQSKIGEKDSEIIRLQSTAKSQQEKNEELTKKLEDKERSHKQQLEEIEAASQQEKEELEQNYQKQKQDLEQFLQSQIRQLEQQLSRIRINGKGQDFTEDLGNGINLEMIAIPGGKFIMGSPKEGEGFVYEQPQHEVTVQPFDMGKFPITQAQYQQIMGKNPSRFKGDERPVECVSWYEAEEFCRRLSKQTGKEYRLPSEAEWEYACRSVISEKLTVEAWNEKYHQPFHFGETITDKLANYDWNVGKTTAVGQYARNKFGLYDMHGNVWEWCQDNWHPDYENAPNDCQAWVSRIDSGNVIRGGSWSVNPSYCRSATRIHEDPENPIQNNIGFRVVCRVPSIT